MVFSASGLETSDVLDGARPIRAVRADNKWRLCCAEEPKLQGTLQHKLLLGGAPCYPDLELAVYGGRLNPCDALVAEIAQDTLQIFGLGSMIDIELNEVVVLRTVRVEPGVDIAGFCPRFEWRFRLVVAFDVCAAEVAHAEKRRECPDCRIVTLVEHPAVVPILDPNECLELGSDDIETFQFGHTERDKCDAQIRRRWQ